MRKLLCFLTFGHWRAMRFQDNEKNTVETTYCRKCGEMLLQMQTFKEPWASIIRGGRISVPSSDGRDITLD